MLNLPTWKISVGLSELPVWSSLPWLGINWHHLVSVRIFKGNHPDLWLMGSWLQWYSHVDVFALHFVLFVSVCVCLATLHGLQDISFPTRDWTWVGPSNENADCQGKSLRKQTSNWSGLLWVIILAFLESVASPEVKPLRIPFDLKSRLKSVVR